MVTAVIGAILVIISALLLYAASPNQLLRSKVDDPKPLVATGSTGLVLGLVLILQWAGPATSVFIALTLAMTVWTIVPLGAAWWCGAPENRK